MRNVLEDIDRGATALDALAAKERNSYPIRSVSIAEFVSRPSLTWIVKNLMPDTAGLGVIWGASTSGKTFAALDLAMAICRGIPWQGLRTRESGCVYVVAEGQGGFVNRVTAYLQHHELDKDGLRLEIVAQPINLFDAEEHLDDLIQVVKDAGERIGPIRVIFIDTLNRVLAGGDENSSKDMGALLMNMQRLADSTGCFIVLVHHCGKDEARGARGHSSLKAAADLEISITNNKGARTLQIEKLKDGQDGIAYGFHLEVVKLGADEDGDPITSCVAVPSDVKPASSKRRFTGAESVALQALKEAIGEHGKRMPETSTIPQGVQAVALEQWRERFKLRYGQDKEREGDAVRKAFLRAKDGLLKGPVIGISDPWVWIC